MAKRAGALDPEDYRAERAVVANDIHFPLQDDTALGILRGVVRLVEPHVIFLAGDIIDAYAVMTHEKDPRKLLGLQEELDMASAFLRDLRSDAPKARIVYIGGNHEARIPRLIKNVMALSSLRKATLPELLNVKEHDVEYHDYGTQIRWSGLIVEHGDRASSHSAATAKKMLDSRGASGISGHVHRFGSHYKTDHSGVKVWFENGSLCRRDKVEYIHGAPNWQTGFSVCHSVKGRLRFYVEQLPIIDGKLFYQGKMWGGR